MERQDAARAEARKTATSVSFCHQFARAIEYELTLVNKWGASADTCRTLHGEVVTCSIRDKYPPRRPNKFLVWLFQFRNKLGVPIFQYNPAPRGFIFNEGGRHLTFDIRPMKRLYRLYLFGLVFMVSNGKPSIRWRG
jgi:hypothetical protein